MVEALGRVVHDDRGALRHGVGEAVDLADVGRDPLLALRGVGRRAGLPDLLAAHGGDVGAAEVPAYAYDAAGEPVCRVRPAAPCADHPCAHGIPAFHAVYARIIGCGLEKRAAQTESQVSAHVTPSEFQALIVRLGRMIDC